MKKQIDHRRLSKSMSHALRHAPDEWGITLDAEGWVAIDELIAGLRKRRGWSALTRSDIEAMMAASDKQRYAIDGERIRAQYGHSLQQKIVKTAVEPPTHLFHGTSPKAASIIAREGLKSMRRQYVHLSADIETATIVGKRHHARPIILQVSALAAHDAGTAFYTEPNGIWLAEPISAEFITPLPA